MKDVLSIDVMLIRIYKMRRLSCIFLCNNK